MSRQTKANLENATKLLAILKGETSRPLPVVQEKIEKACRIGFGGLCLVHGQEISECRKANENG